LSEPKRLPNQPANGIAAIEPKAMQNNTEPNCALLSPKNRCNSGKRDVQLAYKKPFMKKKVETAILMMSKFLFVINEIFDTKLDESQATNYT
jgi:hypothetical protein